MLLKFVMADRADTPRGAVRTDRDRRRIRHSTMFARSIEFSGARLYQAPPWFRKVFSNAGFPMLPTGTAAWAGTLLVRSWWTGAAGEQMGRRGPLQPGCA